MKKRLRNWFKGIIHECMSEIVKKQPTIISYRPPTKDDVYVRGTFWLDGETLYKCESTSAEWKKVDDEK